MGFSRCARPRHGLRLSPVGSADARSEPTAATPDRAEPLARPTHPGGWRPGRDADAAPARTGRRDRAHRRAVRVRDHRGGPGGGGAALPDHPCLRRSRCRRRDPAGDRRRLPWGTHPDRPRRLPGRRDHQDGPPRGEWRRHPDRQRHARLLGLRRLLHRCRGRRRRHQHPLARHRQRPRRLVPSGCARASGQRHHDRWPDDHQHRPGHHQRERRSLDDHPQPDLRVCRAFRR